ncbi:MAG: insulinase family protein, partial [Candidatus Aminicenantes bacterium]|nr:insulinase family protein [Candidatus Aminicenantes bacterium]
QWGERRVVVEAKSQPMMLIGYHRPSYRHKDNIPLEALANILGQGRSSRLYELLVKNKKVAVNVMSFNGFPGEKYSNLMAFYVIPASGHTSAECLELIDEEIEKVKKELVTQEELTKFKRGTVRRLLNEMKSNEDMAAMLTYAEVVLGGFDAAFDQIDQIRAVTPEEVKNVANKYLIKKQRTVGEIVPEK